MQVISTTGSLRGWTSSSGCLSSQSISTPGAVVSAQRQPEEATQQQRCEH